MQPADRMQPRQGQKPRMLQIPLTPAAVARGVSDQRWRKLFVTSAQLAGQINSPSGAAHERGFDKIVAQDRTAQRLPPRQLRQMAMFDERLDADDGIMAPIIGCASLPEVQAANEIGSVSVGGKLPQPSKKSVSVNGHRRR